jgi:hypothetical protein
MSTDRDSSSSTSSTETEASDNHITSSREIASPKRLFNTNSNGASQFQKRHKPNPPSEHDDSTIAFPIGRCTLRSCVREGITPNQCDGRPNCNKPVHKKCAKRANLVYNQQNLFFCSDICMKSYKDFPAINTITPGSEKRVKAVVLTKSDGTETITVGFCNLRSRCVEENVPPIKCHCPGWTCENFIHPSCAKSSDLLVEQNKYFFCHVHCKRDYLALAEKNHKKNTEKKSTESAPKATNSSKSTTSTTTRSSSGTKSSKKKSKITTITAAQKKAARKAEEEEREKEQEEVKKNILKEAEIENSETARAIDNALFPYTRSTGVGYLDLCNTSLELIRLLCPKDPSKPITSEDNRKTLEELSFNSEEHFLERFPLWLDTEYVVNAEEDCNWIRNSKVASWIYRSNLVEEYMRVRGETLNSNFRPRNFAKQQFNKNKNEVIQIHTRVLTCLVFQEYVRDCASRKDDPKVFFKRFLASGERKKTKKEKEEAKKKKELGNAYFSTLLKRVPRSHVMKLVAEVNESAIREFRENEKNPDIKQSPMKSVFRKHMVSLLNKIRKETNSIGCGGYGELKDIKYNSKKAKKRKTNDSDSENDPNSQSDSDSDSDSDSESDSDAQSNPDTQSNADTQSKTNNSHDKSKADDSDNNSNDDVHSTKDNGLLDDPGLSPAHTPQSAATIKTAHENAFEWVVSFQNSDLRNEQEEFTLMTGKLFVTLFQLHQACVYELGSVNYHDIYDTTIADFCLFPNHEDHNSVSLKSTVFTKTVLFTVSQFLVSIDEPYVLDTDALQKWAGLSSTKSFFSLKKKTDNLNDNLKTLWNGLLGGASRIASSSEDTSSASETLFYGFLKIFPEKVIPPKSYCRIARVVSVIRRHFISEEIFPRGWVDVDKLANDIFEIEAKLRLPIGSYLANVSGLASSIVCSKAVLRFMRVSNHLTGRDLHPQLPIDDYGSDLPRCTTTIGQYCFFHRTDVHKAIASLTDAIHWIGKKNGQNYLRDLLVDIPAFHFVEFLPIIAYILKATMQTKEEADALFRGMIDAI